jgi:alginate O-acetyltransferase complex protein AlgI
MTQAPTDLSGHQQLFLDSWHFAAFAAVAVTLSRLPSLLARKLALLLLNGWFVWFFVGDLWSAGVLAALVVITFLVGELQHRKGDDLPAAVPIGIAAVMWAFLFCAKNPALLAPANPFFHWPLRLMGISYIVFRCLQYMLDASQFERRSPLTLVNFIVFWPTLIAGPIERYEKFQAWHDGEERLPPEHPLPALHRLATGCLKKFVLADNLGPLGIFSMSAQEPWTVSATWLAFLIQVPLIYLEFSGYTDIMVGLARLMRLELAENFDRPWLARNVQEFWDRWHMSLTTWVRDYCFTPMNMAIARGASKRWQFPLVVLAYFACMLLIGLWHGTTLGFLCFGLAHATALALLQVLKRQVYPRLSEGARARLDGPVANGLSRALTYLFVSATMLLWFFGPAGAARVLASLVGA